MTKKEIPAPDEELGGESACYAHLLCRACGAMLDEHHVATSGECDNSANDESFGNDTRRLEIK